MLQSTVAGVILALAFSAATYADIHDELNECEFERMNKLLGPTAQRTVTSHFQSADPVDQFCIGYAYWHGFTYSYGRQGFGFAGTGAIPKDPALSAQWMARAAAQGHAGAETILAYYYEQGHGVPKDYSQTLLWLRKALGQNYPDAMYHMGRLYSTGKGVLLNTDTARQWFQKAAGAGSGDAIIELREQQEYQLDQPERQSFSLAYQAYQARNYVRAAALYRQAANAGNAGAEDALGTMLRNGQGVAKDERAGLELYAKAAKAGYARPLAQLSFAFEFGMGGVQVNWKRAAGLCERSAKQLDQLGLYCLGRAYQFGIGVPQNRELAIRYFGRAANEGDGQSHFFAQWLANPGNCAGFRNDYERDHFGLVCEDPKGIAFATAEDRFGWLAAREQKLEGAMARGDAFRRKTQMQNQCRAAGGWGCVVPSF